MAGHAVLVSGEAQPFFCGGFHVDPAGVNVQSTSDVALHGFDIRPQLRALSDHSHIDITDPITLFRNLFANGLK